MIKKFIKWFIDKFPKREVTPEIRRRIKAEFPGYHLAKDGGGRKKKGEVAEESINPYLLSGEELARTEARAKSGK